MSAADTITKESTKEDIVSQSCHISPILFDFVLKSVRRDEGGLSL